MPIQYILEVISKLQFEWNHEYVMLKLVKLIKYLFKHLMDVA
jgi:hypothetical protein